MPKVELTDRFCQTAKPVAEATRTEYFDGAVRGLSLLASRGQRTFYLHYSRPDDGKRVRLKLGTYPDMTLARARERAREARGGIGEGQDPRAQKRARAASQTVSDLVENYIARHAATKRSGKAIARRLRKNIGEVIGDVRLASLHRRDITRCIDAIIDRGAATEANRVFEDARAMLRWARARGDLDENLVEGMKKPALTTIRDRWLSADEISKMWPMLADADMRESTRRIIRLCLVTGQRVGEITGMTREELDTSLGLWTIPSARTKNGREHSVPLSDMALAIIHDQLAAVDALDQRRARDRAPPWVFPGPGARAPTTGHAIAKAVKRAERPGNTPDDPAAIMGVAPWTPHDLRRTMATHMEEFGVSPFVVGHILNHASVTKASITSRVYAKYTYDKEKREALDLWADRLAAILAGDGAEIVPLGARAR